MATTIQYLFLTYGSVGFLQQLCSGCGLGSRLPTLPPCSRPPDKGVVRSGTCSSYRESLEFQRPGNPSPQAHLKPLFGRGLSHICSHVVVQCRSDGTTPVVWGRLCFPQRTGKGEGLCAEKWHNLAHFSQLFRNRYFVFLHEIQPCSLPNIPEVYKTSASLHSPEHYGSLLVWMWLFFIQGLRN